MLEYTQFLVFELGHKCNLSKIHDKCPILTKVDHTNSKLHLTDDKIIQLATEAYNKLGFTGLIAWHFYNEPMLLWKRMLPLMERIRAIIPQSRFLLWTNGTILINDPRFDMFEKVVVTNYNKIDEAVYKDYYRNELTIGNENFDERLVYDGRFSYNPCLRPFVEFIIADSGNVHLCCQDWDNQVSIGNVFEIELNKLVDNKYQITKTICKSMSDNSPETCLKCIGRIGLPSFDDNIAQKTFHLLETLNND